MKLFETEKFDNHDPSRLGMKVSDNINDKMGLFMHLKRNRSTDAGTKR